MFTVRESVLNTAVAQTEGGVKMISGLVNIEGGLRGSEKMEIREGPKEGGQRLMLKVFWSFKTLVVFQREKEKH